MAKLTELIAPSFFEVHKDIKQGLHTHYWEAGGRGSTKSSFISIELILGIIGDKEANAVCYRKVGETLETSVYAQVLWAIDKLGVSDFFRAYKSPLFIEYLPTGQRILFRGLDKAEKSKSIKLRHGYFKHAWFEELDEFAGMEEIRKVTQSLMRGGSGFQFFYSYNPPKSIHNWVNKEAKLHYDNRLFHQSTFLTVPEEWLGSDFILEAEHLKKANELAYRHEYLGEVTGTGGLIFNNVSDLPMSDEMINDFNQIREGIDWGYAVDPFVYLKMHYDRKKRSLYIFDEIYQAGLLNQSAIEKVKAKKDGLATIIADSAEPKSIDEFRRASIKIKGAKKGKDSVSYGIKWLQGLEHIYIDSKRCPNAFLEFTTYELERARDGSFKDIYPDKNNHCLDSTRYALEDDSMVYQNPWL